VRVRAEGRFRRERIWWEMGWLWVRATPRRRRMRPRREWVRAWGESERARFPSEREWDTGESGLKCEWSENERARHRRVNWQWVRSTRGLGRSREWLRSRRVQRWHCEGEWDSWGDSKIQNVAQHYLHGEGCSDCNTARSGICKPSWYRSSPVMKTIH